MSIIDKIKAFFAPTIPRDKFAEGQAYAARALATGAHHPDELWAQCDGAFFEVDNFDLGIADVLIESGFLHPSSALKPTQHTDSQIERALTQTR